MPRHRRTAPELPPRRSKGWVICSHPRWTRDFSRVLGHSPATTLEATTALPNRDREGAARQLPATPTLNHEG